MNTPQKNLLLAHAWECYRSAIDAVDPKKALAKAIKNLGNEFQPPLGKLMVVAIGKASIPMAQAFLELVKADFSYFIVVHPTSMVWWDAPSFVELIPAEHPLPSEGSLKGGKRLIEITNALSPHDTLILLISGGASSLVCAPCEGIPFEDKLDTVKLLLKRKIDIKALNCVRKHLSAIKGGRLVERTSCRKIITFIISDVVGDDISVIASGVSAPDPSTYQEAYEICAKVGVRQSVLAFLERGMKGEYPETPKPGSPVFEKVQNFIIASNKLALEKAVLTAFALGYRSMVLTDSLTGEARTVGRKLAWLLKAMKAGSFIALGGETVVNVVGSGKGGRCQELALSAGIELDKTDNVLLWATGSDGIDGVTDSAGAWVDGLTMEKARKLGIATHRCLADNNSNFFFDQVNELIKTGPTGTNVMDLIFLIRG